VASIVTLASSPGGPGAFSVPDETAALWRANAHLPGEQFARRTMPHSFAPGWTGSHPQEYAAFLAARITSPTSPAAWAAQSAACEKFLAGGLQASDGPRQPVTGVHGDLDRVVPYENLAVLGRRLPHARLVTLRGAGHLCWLERPGEVNQVIRDHLARVDQTQTVSARLQEEPC
jgi:pimeloyl-ACP methyl ester carboxylesterase